jgi:surfactin synthase thioesterase subunit
MKRNDTNKNRLQLKDDPSSIQRRQWYQTMQEPFFENYEKFQHLQTVALHEGKFKEIDEKKAQELLSDRSLEEILQKSNWIVKLNSIKVAEWKSVIFCIAGIGTNHSMFAEFAETTLAQNAVQAFGICLPGKMHRINDSKAFSLRILVYMIYQELISSGILSLLQQIPIAFLGYCSGSLICYDLLRLILKDRSKYPELTINGMISIACRSPLRQSKYNIDIEGRVFYCNKKPLNWVYYPDGSPEITDAKLINALFEFGAIPLFFRERRELLKKFFPLFRYDFLLLETYIIEPPFIAGGREEEPRDLNHVVVEFQQGFYSYFYAEMIHEIVNAQSWMIPEPFSPPFSSSTDVVVRSPSRERNSKKANHRKEESKKRPGSLSPLKQALLKNHENNNSATSLLSTARTPTTVEKQGSFKTQNSFSSNGSRANTERTSSTSPSKKPPRKDARLSKFQEDMENDLFTMPVSLFKISVPIFTIASTDDTFVSNEEDIKAWSSHSSLGHHHYSISGGKVENHFYFHSEENLKSLDLIIRQMLYGDETQDNERDGYEEENYYES